MEATGDTRHCPGRVLLLLMLLLLLLPPRRDPFGVMEQQPGEQLLESLVWAVRLTGPQEYLDQLANDLVQEAHLVNVDQIKGHYLLACWPTSTFDPAPRVVQGAAEVLFMQHAGVGWHVVQHLLKRSKHALHFNNPKFP